MNCGVRSASFQVFLEMLERTFDNELQWKDHGDACSVDGTTENIDVRVSLSSVEYYGEHGVNIVFSVKTPSGEFSQDIGSVKASQKQTVAIIGAVSNAVLDRIDHYDWEFVTIAAKDNIDTRMKLYNRIADRLKSKLGLLKFSGFVKRQGIIVLGKPGTEELINRFKKEAVDKE